MLMNSLQAPVLIVITPLFTALFATILGLINKRFSYYTTIIGLVITTLLSYSVLNQVIDSGFVEYKLSGWMPPFGIQYAIDHLNAIVLLMVSFISLMVAIYSKRSVEDELKEKTTYFYTLFVLLTCGLLGITITGDAFNIYVLLEIAALSSYALLALGSTKRAALSTFNYLIMGSIGACFYLLGVGYIFMKTGTLNIIDIHSIIPAIMESKAIFVGFSFITIGLFVKMAFFPLHGWLPNAYTYAPTATSALVAPLMTKVSVYALVRVCFFLFGSTYIFEIFKWSKAFVLLAIIAIIMGSLFALGQKNIKKMLCYLIVAEIGYMVGGIFIGNAQSLSGAIYHIIADGFMTACLFMAIGAIIYKTGSSDISVMKGMFRKMPITMIVFCIGAFSMIGIPPTCGFVSKWYLISGAFEAGQYAFIIALLFSSLINAILFFRIIETAFFESTADETPNLENHKSIAYAEAPLSMTIPMLIVAGSLLFIGLYTSTIMSKIIDHIVTKVF